jgi:hypothetical protein
MNILPKGRDQWIALTLFPFKAWVLIAFPFCLYVANYATVQHVRYGAFGLFLVVLAGYKFSAVVLLLGGLVQSMICSRKAAIWTAIFAVASILLVYVLNV